MGGPEVRPAIQIVKELWDHCLAKSDHTYSLPFTRDCKRSSGQAVSGIHRFEQLDAGQTNFPANKQQLGSVSGRFVCGPFKLPTSKIRELEARPSVSVIRCIPDGMEDGQAYRFSPFCLIGRCLAKLHKDQSQLVLIAPLWQTQPWYPRLLHMSVACPILLPPVPKLLTSPTGQVHPLVINGTLKLAAWKLSGISQMQARYQNTAEHLVKSARRPGTKLAYATPWRMWCSWCDKRQISPTTAPVESVVNFL